MNIFVLDSEPDFASRMLCDCHLRKMCVETAQILSGVMLRRGMTLSDTMPKPQNINHPVIAAVGKCNQALRWVLTYDEQLSNEYAYRFDKPHKFGALLAHEYQRLLIPTAGGAFADCRNLARCCGDLDTGNLSLVDAYKKYYRFVKRPQLQAKKLWKFTNREDWTL